MKHTPVADLMPRKYVVRSHLTVAYMKRESTKLKRAREIEGVDE